MESDCYPEKMELFLLMFADDITLLLSTPVGVQNQLNVLYEGVNRLVLLGNLEKTKIVLFRNGDIWQGKRDGTMEVSHRNA